ncbi:MAG: four helix bundle protein [Pyrinomonadaceae bacterium]|nr:four helix bundle protein [Pyrinomonadaceae bacterium]
MSQSILKEKSYSFALRAVRMCRYLTDEKKEFVLSKQILRSGTSIGANIEEAFQGQSNADFIHKLSISLKESFETNYWLRLLRDAEYLSEKESESMLADCEELQKLLTASVIKAKNR